MWYKSAILFALVCICASALVRAQGYTPIEPTTPLATTTTSTPPPTTPSTTPSTTSTVPPTTSSTSPPPPTTTSAPVTTSAPPSKRGNWTVSENNVTCIVVQMVISSKIVYPLPEPNKTRTAEVEVPGNAEASGTCSKDSQSLILQWNSNKFSITFGKNTTTKNYFLTNISLNVLVDNNTFPNISEKWVGQNLSLESKSLEFTTSVNNSYRCSREQDLPLHFNGFPGAVLVLSQVQLQAFLPTGPAVFGEAQDCELDTPDIVPIAVGCALAALVFVVLAAYLYGRRRSQARGYLSM